jgi:hypothetical protein
VSWDFIMGAIKRFDNLNTSFVNLAAFIRYLRAQNFSGSVHVAIGQYEAEIFLKGSDPTVVFEIDRAAGSSSQDEGAIERVLVHAREPGGTITVYEGKTEPGSAVEPHTESAGPAFTDEEIPVATAAPDEEVDWDELLRAGGDTIAAVEGAVQSSGLDFAANLRTACIELGDDYPFLDPSASNFSYANGAITLNDRPSANAYVTGLSEGLRRLVNKLAIDKEGKRFRERVAVELAVASRMRPVGAFTPLLDRIAGTRVL